MQYKYVSKAIKNVAYNENGVCVTEQHLDEDFFHIKNWGIKWYRCNIKAGASYQPDRKSDCIVLLCFNGKRASIVYGDQSFHVTEPSMFLPDFDRSVYTVHAVEDVEFMMGVFPMNQYDWEAYNNFRSVLPFFRPYSQAPEYDQSDCKLLGTHSWILLQTGMFGRVTMGCVRSNGTGTDEAGHAMVEQWNYVLGNSEFEFSANGITCEHRPGGFFLRLPWRRS